MPTQIRASEAGLQQVDVARLKKNWGKQETAWYGLALTSLATLKRFWQRKRIDVGAFESICKAVGIENWEAIVDLTSPTPSTHPLNYPFPQVSTYNPQFFTGREVAINKRQFKSEVHHL